MSRRALAVPVAALAAASCATAWADTQTTAFAGLEVGENSTHRLDAGANVRFLDDWNAGLSLSRAHVEFPDVSADSTLAVAKLGYDFGAFSVGGGYRRGDIEKVSESRGWLVNAGYVHEELRFGLEIESREVTLEPAAFTEDLGGAVGTATGVSRCSVDGRGYQGRVDWDRPTWSLFVSWRVFDYDDYDCVLEISSVVAPPGNGGGNGHGNGPPPHARGRALGRRLAAAAVDDVAGAPSRLVPREAALLDSSASLGFTMPVTPRWIGGAELYRDVERIAGSDTLTGLVFAGRRLSDIWSLELSLGYSMADEVDDTAFAGARVSAAL